MNPSKQKGTAFETALVNWLTGKYAVVKRIVLHGNKDEGDIEVTGYGDNAGYSTMFNIEAKNCNTLSLSTWVKEAEVESENSGVPVVVVAKRKGISDPGKSYVITTLEMFQRLV